MNKLNKNLITLTKSDVMFLIASAMGYGWNTSGGYQDVDFEKIQKRKELDKKYITKIIKKKF